MLRIILLYLIPVIALCQKHEFGGGITVNGYTGDLSTYVKPLDSRPGIEGIHRWNLHKLTSMKNTIGYGFLAGRDQVNFDALSANRDFTFSSSLVYVSSAVEFNFFDFMQRKSYYTGSPYAFVGLGALYIVGASPQPNDENYSNVQVFIPFGGGAKKKIGDRWILSGEVSFNATFTDYLDNISTGIQQNKNYLFGNSYDNDWFYQVSIRVSYIIYTIPCPFDYN